MSVLARLFAFFSVGFFLLAAPTSARELSGAWISPDWLLPGHRSYREPEVRQIAREAMTKLADSGVDTVFLETFLRGNGICRSISSAPDSPESYPAYPHLDWNYRVEFDTVLDPLQIFIEEAQLVGIEVHAWVHMFYWRMDNNDIMLGWHNGPTVWAELMENYLRR